jgi:hypothetical protein
MTEIPSAPPLSTFVVRFWREWSVAGGQWRGRIVHLQSGERATFLDLQGVLDFFLDAGIMSTEESQAGEGDA